MFGPNQITCGDCLGLMSEIPPSSVDMILCDLPFGVSAPQWDRCLDMTLLWSHYKRIIKKSGTIALFASQPFTTKLISSNERQFRYCWYWIKNQGTNFFHAKSMPIRKVEEICIFGKGQYHPQITDGHVPTNSAKGTSKGQAYFGTNTRNENGGKTTRFPTNVLNFKCVSNYQRLHPAQKPVDLCEYLIKTYTDEGETILDNCCGSGSILVAAQNTKRRFIGMDISEEFCQIARNRCSPP